LTGANDHVEPGQEENAQTNFFYSTKLPTISSEDSEYTRNIPRSFGFDIM
jgi:hypothetical protein